MHVSTRVITPATVVTGSGTGSSGASAGGTPQAALVCFEAEIMPIFRNTCAKSGCHNAASHNKDYVFETYAGIMKGITPKNLDDSKVYRMITEDDPRKRMPKDAPRLSDTTINLIKRWIMEGANNTTNCSNGCDTSLFTYARVVKPIIDANCVSCHNGPAAPKGLDYTTYTGLSVVALDGRLVRAISHAAGITAMPYGGEKLSDCNIAKIRKWVNDGAKNN